jgi:hypothetical protein
MGEKGWKIGMEAEARQERAVAISEELLGYTPHHLPLCFLFAGATCPSCKEHRFFRYETKRSNCCQASKAWVWQGKAACT